MTAEQRAWPTPDLRPRAGSWKATRRCCCGRPGDQPVPPVCIGSLFVDAGVASFSLGVTLPEARRRGYWAAMAGVRLVDAPGLPAVGVFSDMSRPSAEALGFLPITRLTLWHRPRP